ncbi:SUKH-4 family immunity protein [Streptomyces sp. NBC_00285]|uniref:SUKH-4 family immunity protein n=1 Tax=Streptomyces sp. NBC_00285 TaxID=2975700 RepID=UPI002E2BB6ED|nr:SUKH-4 family immunity protein [Streptomyces sp. NBC_00285]
MVTFAQAQERAEEWINGDVPSYQHREVRVREFGLGFVVWAEDRAEGPRSDGGAQRLVIARDSGEATLWPSLPVGEVIRRYEEEYGREDGPEDAGPGGAAAARVDLNQTSFLLSPPEWLQDAADKLGIGAAGAEAGAGAPAGAGAAVGDEVAGGAEVPAGARPWTGTDTNGGEDLSVALPETVFSPPLNVPSGTEEVASPDSEVSDSRTARISGTRGDGAGSNGAGVAGAVPPSASASASPSGAGGSSYGYPQGPGAAGGPSSGGPGTGAVPPSSAVSGGSSYGYPQAVGSGPGGPGGHGVPGPPPAPSAGDIADVATSRLAPPTRGEQAAGSTPPHPPGAPGAPGVWQGSGPTPPPGGGGYVPTQFVSAPGADGTASPGTPQNPPVPGPAAATPHPPGPPGFPGAQGWAGGPQSSGVTGAPQGAQGGPGAVHHAETMLSAPPMGGPGMPPPPPGAVAAPGLAPPPGQPVPGPPPAYGYPPQSQPTVGPGYQAVLRYRAQDGSEQQLIRRSAPGTPHPEWQIFHELRGMNVPPDQVLELHTELESCELPGAYCARMIREQWPQARLASIAPYGTDHASRQQGMRQLLLHQGELHQVADGPARPAPVRSPLPPVQAAPPVPPEGVAQELAGAFGPGIFRFEQAAVSRQGVPPVVAHSLVVAGLPLDMGPFFWAQAQPGRPVPTLAELAAERGVQPASDAGSYLVMGSDFGKAVCVQYGTANIVAVPVEAGPGGAPVPPQFVNTGLPEFQRCLALLGRMWRLRFGLNQEQAGRWTVDFQAQLASLDPAALGSPESWWSVLLEQMWDGLL